MIAQNSKKKTSNITKISKIQIFYQTTFKNQKARDYRKMLQMKRKIQLQKEKFKKM